MRGATCVGVGEPIMEFRIDPDQLVTGLQFRFPNVVDGVTSTSQI